MITGIRVRLAAPSGAEQLLVGDQVAARADELLEQRELDRREGQELSAGPCLVTARVDPDRARGRGRCGAGVLRLTTARIRASSSSFPNGLVM